MTPVIETSGLTKQYGEVRAVSDLTLTVKPGEVFGFLGPNGAGKSTTIDMLLDYVRPTAGTVRVFGLDPRADIKEIHARMGVLPDGVALYDRLTGRHHLEFAIGVKGADDTVEDLLDRVSLDRVAATRRVGSYSRGMRQRLALAMALVGSPDLLVLDEPQNGLDPHGMREMRDIICAEADRGATVFFSSHILSEVEAVADRVGIMNRGVLVAVDSIDSLRTDLEGGVIVDLVVEGAVDEDALAAIDYVTIGVVGQSLTVECSQDVQKSALIADIEATGVTVTDVGTRRASLEDLFTAFTTDVDSTDQSTVGAGVPESETDETQEVTA
ncbi:MULTISPECIES: ABC transporter ATP-binding protein [Haloferax]|uniref:ATP-binding cassette domain-containing protein n=1 Tax=Haloferax marinum TaxID=2666143 RepID=A0A6A8G6K6_9EURY|nr:MULTISPECIES: ABC transporter ATP-binding protein [Haloferax]KAB1197219.1 ABC transporter ATP-binding protein [Haloferax sp. CBA1150]MRW96258.1 ATP-binding cassette domain-containing protein [Haloferax marinum]